MPVLGFPHRPGSNWGGPATFQTHFGGELERRGWEVVYPDDERRPDVVLVVGGTARLRWLAQCRARGAKIVHRLDGISWRHRFEARSLKERVKPELQNIARHVVRDRLAHAVIYQSRFSEQWWRHRYGPAPVPEAVVYNGVDTGRFGAAAPPVAERPELLLVEGNLDSDPVTRAVVRGLMEGLVVPGDAARLVVYGSVRGPVREILEPYGERVHLAGKLDWAEMPQAYERDALYVSLDVVPACPNAVLEALASRLPVLGFATGAVSELVGPDVGRTPAYGADPWRFELPDIPALVGAGREAIAARRALGRAARRRAVERFSLQAMTDGYLAVFAELGVS